jgi:hypothetical protein
MAFAVLQRRGVAITSAKVRLVCFGDIHMAFQAIERLAPALREADCAILTGDLTHFGDPPDAFRVVDAVRAHCPNVLAATGNLDFVCSKRSPPSSPLNSPPPLAAEVDLDHVPEVLGEMERLRAILWGRSPYGSTGQVGVGLRPRPRGIGCNSGRAPATPPRPPA